MTVDQIEPVDRQILELLADGQERTALEIVAALCPVENFTARRDFARQVQRVLPGLVGREYVRRLSYHDGPRELEEKFVDAKSIGPVCLGCYRGHWSPDSTPAQSTGFAVEQCGVCRRRMNNGAYVPIAEITEVRERLA